MATRRGAQDAVRITTAPINRRDDIAARQRRYLLSMSLRTICFVGAIIASLAGVHWLWPILIAGAIVLPYFAVVMANAATGRRPEAAVEAPGFQHPELGAARVPSGPYHSPAE
jgi:uncharacterized membrane protein